MPIPTGIAWERWRWWEIQRHEKRAAREERQREAREKEGAEWRGRREIKGREGERMTSDRDIKGERERKFD